MGSLRGFSWHGPTRLPFRPKPSGGPVPGACIGGICRPEASHTIRGIHRPLRAVPCVTPSVMTPSARFGNINPISIGYASRPRLRTRLTLGGLSLPRKPWTYGARVFHPRFRILMPAFSFPIPPARIATRLPRPTERSPTTLLPESTTSVTCLVPIIFGAGPLDQ